MSAFQFEAPDRPPEANWWIHIDSSDEQSSVMSAVRLEINTRDPGVLSTLQADKKESPSVRLLQAQLRVDIARQFIRYAIQLRKQGITVADISRMPYDSIAQCSMRFASRMIRLGYLTDLRELQEMLDEQSSLFEALLQAAFLRGAK
jgi:hypothetical protein